MLGGFLTLPGILQTPSRIVCYDNYTDILLQDLSAVARACPLLARPAVQHICTTLHHVLQSEIRISAHLPREDKERRMVEGIRRSLQRGYTVVMFIDGLQGKRMRALNEKVLTYFPQVSKQLVHLLEPTHVNEFRFRRYPATTCLNEILLTRDQRMLDNPHTLSRQITFPSPADCPRDL